MSHPPSTLSLDNCDKEPIHIPGVIQSFGGLLATSLNLTNVTYASQNIGAMLGRDMDRILGQSITDILPDDLIHEARNILSYTTSQTQRERVGSFHSGEREIELYVHQNPDQCAILEFEDMPPPGNRKRSPIDTARLFLAKAGEAKSVEALLEVGAVGMRELTGYDRVKAYRYAADGSGEVVAESKTPEAESFLGLRYPAWDVPAQARALQIKNPVRVLWGVTDEPVPILAADEALPPLDLSLAHLRGVSPIHVQYLKNMGVESTLTVGLIVDGELWGMFACHHMSKHLIQSETRIAAELFGQLMSLMIKQRLEADEAAARIRAAAARQKIIVETDATTDLLHGFSELSDVMRGLIDCDGLAVFREDKLQSVGSVPSPGAIRAIAAQLDWDEALLESTDHLAASNWHQGHNLNDSAGCLIVRATAAFPLELMFFRNEKIKRVEWAGKPEKEYDTGPWGSRITPRGSFEAYVEEQAGRSEPWRHTDLAAAREIQAMLTQITTKGERAELARHKDLVGHKRQQDLLIAELNHRVKNILALIRSLSRQAKASSTSLESYALALEQRIAALAAAHDLAVSDSMAGVSLEAILRTEIGPFARNEKAQVLMSGPKVGLRPDVAPLVALVFHEIISNAAKYGALSTAAGVVQIIWNETDAGLEVSWRELGGPVVTAPDRNGFGRTLIEKAVPYELDGRASLEFPPAGVTFDLFLPKKTLTDHAEALKDGSDERFAGQVGEFKTAASGRKVLVVEDNLVLAMDMVESVTRLGADGIVSASTLEFARRELAAGSFDLAILDMNIRGTVVLDFAETLAERGIPFVFVTGYGSSIDVPEALAGVPILTKPVDDALLAKGIAQVIA